MAGVTEARAIPIVALDVPRAADARHMVSTLGELCRFYKVGLELFTAEGPAVVRELREAGCEVFLDLKFHDIPNTVRGAVRAAARLGARLVTVHASGGRAMVEAAVEGANEGAGEEPRCEVLAVSVLTSLGPEALASAWGRSADGLSVEQEVLRLARFAREAGAHGLVCSGAEARAVRDEAGDGLALLVPGIRFAKGSPDDQARVVTPRAAVEAGARYLVIGRPITGAKDPAAAMRALLDEIA